MSNVFGETYRCIRLCVDSYENGELKGRCYNAGMKDGGRKFDSLSQFLVSVENLFDSMNFPQAYAAKRAFAPPPETPPGDSAGPGGQTGKRGTFLLRVMFRQHASWQGSVVWLEGGGEQVFRSVLELVFLMDSALGGCGEGAA